MKKVFQAYSRFTPSSAEKEITRLVKSVGLDPTDYTIFIDCGGFNCC